MRAKALSGNQDGHGRPQPNKRENRATMDDGNKHDGETER